MTNDLSNLEVSGCVGLDNFVNPSKTELSVYLMVRPANGNSTRLLAILSSSFLVEHKE